MKKVDRILFAVFVAVIVWIITGWFQPHLKTKQLKQTTMNTVQLSKLDLLFQRGYKRGYASGRYRAALKSTRPVLLHSNFTCFDEMQEFAQENELTIIELRQKSGDVYYTHHGEAFEPMDLTADRYGDNYTQIDFEDYKDESDFVARYVREPLLDMDDLDDIRDYLHKCAKTWEAVDDLLKGERLILCDGEVFEVVDCTPLSFEIDTTVYTYGLTDSI